MLDSVSSIALSGLNAARTQLEVAASNIANQNSTGRVENGAVLNEPYRAKDVVTLSAEAGGVRTEVRESNRPFPTAYSPESLRADASGTVRLPNTDLAQDLVSTKQAEVAYKANLQVLTTGNEMTGALLDAVE